MLLCPMLVVMVYFGRGWATYSVFLASPTERQRVEGVCGTRDLQQGLLLSSSAEPGVAWLPLGDCGEVGTSCSCCGWWVDGAAGVECCC